MKRAFILFPFAVVIVTAVSFLAPTRAQTPRDLATAAADVPVTADPEAIARLQLAADQAFAAENYAAALEMYKKLALQLRGDKGRLEPVLERVRVCERMLARNAAADAGLKEPAERVPHAPPAGDTYRLTIQQLGNFEFDPLGSSPVPADVLALDGATVQVTGYMIPMQQARRITQFALVPDLFQCCFGQPPQLHHTIVVNTPPGKSVPYFPEELVCTGTLRVEKKMEDGFVIGLFELDVTSVKPAPR